MKKNILFIVTSPLVIDFFLKDLLVSLEKKYTLTLIYNKHENFEVHQKLHKFLPSINFIHTPIRRNISIFFDLLVLFHLTFILFFKRYSIVHTITPKAGLLGMIAARITFHRIRIHTFQGEVWFNKKGLKRLLLIFTDYITSKFSTSILTASKSELGFLKKNKIIDNIQDARFILNGSIIGVNLKKYYPLSESKIIHLKKTYKINSGFNFLFVGRINHDKGIVSLIKSYQALKSRGLDVNLLIVGPVEDNFIYNQYIKNNFSVQYFPYTSNPELFMNIADCLVLPSHREGFGLVVIESAACNTPSIASNIVGLKDSIVHNKTGLLINNSYASLLLAMQLIIKDKNLYLKLSRNAREHIKNKFDRKYYISFYHNFYNNLLNKV